MSRNEVPLPYIRWTLLAWGVVCTLANCWFSCAAYHSSFAPALSSTWAGFVAGQAAWIAICSVLATWSLFHRGLYCVIAALALVLSSTVSEWYRAPFFWGRMPFPFRETLALPVLILAIQLPFWAVRTWLGWRLEQPASSSSKDHAPALGIRDLLFAMTCIALALCAFRLSVPPNLLKYRIAEYTEICGSCALTSLLVAVPAAALVLRPSRAGTAACVTALYQVCLFGLTFGVMGLLPGFPPARIPIYVMIFAAVFFLSLDFPLFVVRRLGWRLSWRKWCP